ADGLRVTWNWHRWPSSQYQCWYAVTADRWLETPDAGDRQRGEFCRILDMEFYDRHCRQSGGVAIVPPPGARGGFVTIWPVIALGWRDVIGDPLHVGPLPARARNRWLAAFGFGQ